VILCSAGSLANRKIWAAFIEISALLDTKKDLPDLASINPHDLGIWAIWANVGITELCAAWSVA